MDVTVLDLYNSESSLNQCSLSSCPVQLTNNMPFCEMLLLKNNTEKRITSSNYLVTITIGTSILIIKPSFKSMSGNAQKALISSSWRSEGPPAPKIRRTPFNISACSKQVPFLTLITTQMLSIIDIPHSRENDGTIHTSWSHYIFHLHFCVVGLFTFESSPSSTPWFVLFFSLLYVDDNSGLHARYTYDGIKRTYIYQAARPRKLA